MSKSNNNTATSSDYPMSEESKVGFPKGEALCPSVLPSRLKSYQDRSNLLEEIEEKFKSKGKIQVLAGLSGVGKTQLAYEYGRRLKGEYIIEASSEESYVDSISRINLRQF